MSAWWRAVDASRVRAVIARQILSPPDDSESRRPLGRIELRAHQRAAVTRLEEALGRFGGALLADHVGLGKTYTALAVARDESAVLIVAPAALREMWQAALAATGVRATLVSHEALSRSAPPPRGAAPRCRCDLVIVDEAHHARNPATRRYRAIAELTRGARVLLLSATPVHNSERELATLLALFLGDRASRVSGAELAACVVRRTRDQLLDRATMPRLAPARRVEMPDDAAILHALLATPPPCPPRDGGDGGALVKLTLIRAWGSSDGALRTALRRRIDQCDALCDALAAGRHPTRSELAAWSGGEPGTLQLALPGLVAAYGAANDEARALLAAAEQHRRGVAAVLDALRSRGDRDSALAERLREIRRLHPGVPVVAFSMFAETVEALFRQLRRDAGVGALTARGARVAGGALTRREALDRFAPTARGASGPRAVERIDLLLATDVLSEGLNLQDAGVVVHLDLPWTAARMEQRVGRVWRLGSRHEVTHEYAFLPPAAAELVLRTTMRLEAKAAAARRTVGPLAVRPSAAEATTRGDGASDESAPASAEAVRAAIARWCDDGTGAGTTHLDDSEVPLLAAVVAPARGWIALVRDGAGIALFGSDGGSAATDDPRAVLGLVRHACGDARDPPRRAARRALGVLRGHLAARRAARLAGREEASSRAHAAAAARIASAVAAAPPHRRAAIARAAAAARASMGRMRGAGAELALAELALAPPDLDGDPRESLRGRARGGATSRDAEADAERWLARVISLDDGASASGGATESRGAPIDDGLRASAPRVVALLLLVPGGAARATGVMASDPELPQATATWRASPTSGITCAANRSISSSCGLH